MFFCYFLFGFIKLRPIKIGFILTMYITQVIIIKKLDIILPNTGVSNLMRLYKNNQYHNSKMEFLKRF